jgi:hypothetical protein
MKIATMKHVMLVMLTQEEEERMVRRWEGRRPAGAAHADLAPAFKQAQEEGITDILVGIDATKDVIWRLQRFGKKAPWNIPFYGGDDGAGATGPTTKGLDI